MDKYEYRIRAEEINALIDKKEYVEAVKIADTIDWRRVKSVMMLCKISELYKINRRYEDSKEILLLAYDRNPGSRKIVYSLCELAIKLEETVQAVEYYKEFVQLAPRDTGKFILQYRLYEAQDVSLEERIAVLEEYKKRDYREKWAYELAYLYHRIGLATRCVEECDELILWFGEGKYVIKAMELKMLHCPLTASQQEKYDKRFAKEEPVYENNEEAADKQPEDESALPIEITAIEPSDGPTAKIPSKEVEAELSENAEDAETVDEETADEEAVQEEVSKESEEQEEAAEEETAENEEEVSEEEEIPLTPPDDDLDIKVKTIDVDNEYSTINLQQELAKSLAKFMAEEDMVASDATLAMPFATLAEAATSDTIMGAITDDSIKNAIIAPLLQDTTELTPITEEDLLASMTEDEENQLKEQGVQASAETIRIPAEVQAASPVQMAQPQVETEKAVQPVQMSGESQEQQPVQEEEKQEPAAQIAEQSQEEEPVENVQPAQEAEPVDNVQLAQEAEPVDNVQPAQEADKPAQEVQSQKAHMAEQPVQETAKVEQPQEQQAVAEEEPVQEVHSVQEAQPVQATATEPAEPVQNAQMAQATATETTEPLQMPEQAQENPVAQMPEQAQENSVAQMAAQPQEASAVQVEEQPQEPAEPVQEVHNEQPVQMIQPEAFEPETSELKVSEPETSEPEASLDEQLVDEQITGQLSLEDIMAEWEETKKASEERRIKEMRERVIQQTGPMFSNFDAMARASVSTDLDLISPAEDVFKNDHLDEEPKSKNYIEDIFDLEEEQIDEDLEDSVEETENEAVSEKPHSTTFNTEEIFGLEEKLLDVLNSPEMKEETPIEPISIDSSFFEETKEEVQHTEPEAPVVQTQEPEKPVAPVIPLSEQPLVQQAAATETPAMTQIWQPVRPEAQTEAHTPQSVEPEKQVIPLSEQPLVQQAMAAEAGMMSHTPQPVEPEKPVAPVIPLSEQPLVQQAMTPAAPVMPEPPVTPVMPQAPQPAVPEMQETPVTPIMPQAPQPAAPEIQEPPVTPVMPQAPQPAAPEIQEPPVTPIMPQAPQPAAPEVQQTPETPIMPMMYQPQSAAEAVAAMRARTGVIPQTSTPEPKHQAQSAAEAVAAMKSSMPHETAAQPVSQPSTAIPGMAQQAANPGVSIGNPVDLKNTEYLQAYMPKQDIPARSLTKEERGRFASFAPSREEQIKVAKALDSVTLSAAVGNMFITGEQGTNTLQAAQNVVIDLTEKHPEFSGRVAKITGKLLAEKDIGATLESMENGALIIEKAGSMPADAVGNLLFHLDRLKERRVFIIMEDTKSEIERMSLLYPEMAVKFSARMDIEALDNDGLVNYAKEYAKEQEYAIDDMGILALYTKISDLQTNEHAVTVTEVRDMVDKAIASAGKKNVAHFMDIILAKRYDGDDMIILREKDFLN